MRWYRNFWTGTDFLKMKTGTENRFEKNRIKYLDLWTKGVLGLSEDAELTRKSIEDHQLEKLNSLFDYVRKNSDFYSNLYSGFSDDFRFEDLQDIEKLPFTSAEDLRADPEGFLCVSPKEIKRIVTLNTSGTTGRPKKVFFTEEDQALSAAHFQNGMQYLTDTDGKVLVLLPHERPGSVGDLLAGACRSLGADVTFDADDSGITCICGLPSVLAEMAEDPKYMRFRKTVSTVLLTGEYVSPQNIATVQKSWECMAFEHYGMTEMGLGGAVTCTCLDGYHPREHDLLFEIIDPETGSVLPDGEYGEVVFTSLTRKGMPFIRYRTGDISMFMPEPCPCGSVLKRIARVGDRREKKGWRER